MAAAVDLQLVVRGEVFELHDLLFQLGREDVDAADDEHIVTATADPVHTTHGTGCAGQQARQVAGAITDHRQRLLGQRGKQQFALLAIIKRRAVVRVNDLRIEMIFPDGRTVGGFDTLHRHAWPHDLGKPIDIQRGDPQTFLDFAAHGLRPRLCAKHPHTQGAGAGIASHLALQLFDQIEAVGWRHHDHVRLEIADQLRLFLRLTAGHRDNGRP